MPFLAVPFIGLGNHAKRTGVQCTKELNLGCYLTKVDVVGVAHIECVIVGAIKFPALEGGLKFCRKFVR